MFAYLEEVLISLAHTMSLPVFVFVASFIEEVIAPIPSPTVMVVAGSLAKVQSYLLYGLVPLAILGAAGKTVGALVVYGIADKAENLIMQKFEKFFNVTHEDVEKLGSALGGGPRDYVALTIIRALPFVPSVVISVGSGLLKISLPLFVVTTFLGTLARDGVYLYAGYIGTEAFTSLISGSNRVEKIIEIIVVLCLVGFLGYCVYRRKKNNMRSSM